MGGATLCLQIRIPLCPAAASVATVIRVPTETVTEIKDNKRREVERKIFPGYVLVKMVLTDDSWYVVRNIRGCTGFVGPIFSTVSTSYSLNWGHMLKHQKNDGSTKYGTAVVF
ncbi:hypothetical protein IAG03_04470 [Clostridiales bacterium NSJ-40]|uniref:NusG-like N-terminal domain-containing protein n=1 Tax=Yeguia hominis TaxID=2763662 RepID=A0A926HML6_9FIRM|nr:hypothetical protein [Yeguia hominis]